MRVWLRMRRNFAQLHAGPGDDFVRLIIRARHPAKVFAALKHLSKPVQRLDAKRFNELRRKLAHISKHPGAMPTDQFKIGSRGYANLKLRHGDRLLSGGRFRFPPNQFAVDLGAPPFKQIAHCGREESLIFPGINLEKNLAAGFELSLEQVVQEKIPLLGTPTARFIGAAIECGREGGDQIKFAVEVRERFKRLNAPDSSLDTKKIEKFVANFVMGDVEADSGVTELFGKEQKETGATTKIENLFRRRSIESESPRAREIAFQPACRVGVLGVVICGRCVPPLNIAQPLLVDPG